MKRTLLSLITAILIATGFSSCDVHEFGCPDTPPAVDPFNHRIDLTFVSGTMDFLTEINVEQTKNGASRSRADGDQPHDMRFMIQLFAVESRGTGYAVTSRAPVDSYIFTRPASEGLTDYVTSVTIPEGDYKILVWADYVAEGTTTDRYYSTDDFSQLELLTADADGNPLAHSGCNNYRDAFRGELLVSVTGEGQLLDFNTRQPLNPARVPMNRPMARYHFITTDLGDFISKLRSHTDTPADALDHPAAAPDLNDYTVRFRYSGYMPSAYNAHTDKPVDSRLGVSYTGSLRQIDAHEAELGFDYVLVNGTQTSVKVAVDILDRRSGKTIASTDPIEVPLQRNRYTVVKGHFLTATAGGGIGIDPGFFDDFNIEIY